MLLAFKAESVEAASTVEAEVVRETEEPDEDVEKVEKIARVRFFKIESLLAATRACPDGDFGPWLN